MAHYDLELHQMDVKTVFLNGDLYGNNYMAQPKRLCRGRKEHIGGRLQKSIYGLKVNLQTVVFKVDEMIRKFGFKEKVFFIDTITIFEIWRNTITIHLF